MFMRFALAFALASTAQVPNVSLAPAGPASRGEFVVTVGLVAGGSRRVSTRF
jgi:hypothetical protein